MEVRLVGSSQVGRAPVLPCTSEIILLESLSGPWV